MGSKKHERENVEQAWDRLGEDYRTTGLVLALGAGVSVESGLPTWAELLSRIAARCSRSGSAIDCERLRKKEVSLTQIAGVLEELAASAAPEADRLQQRERFVEFIRDALYEQFPYYKQDIGEHNRRQFIADIKATNPTLHALATLCAIGADPRGPFEANRRIRGIVTLNLDGLLQAYAYARFAKRILRTIERASASAFPDRISVYHMHGFLRFDSKARHRDKEAMEVILSEKDFFRFFNDPMGLFTYTFLYLLREAPCLFIGLSMEDLNIRRMLSLSRDERMHALESEGASPQSVQERSIRHYAVLRRSDDLEYDKVVNASLRALGTRTLWIDEWGEIPARVRTLYESTGDRWDVVA